MVRNFFLFNSSLDMLPEKLTSKLREYFRDGGLVKMITGTKSPSSPPRDGLRSSKMQASQELMRSSMTMKFHII